MSDGLVIAIGVVLVLAVPFDVYVAAVILAAALQPPRIAALTFMAAVSIAIAISASLSALIAVSAILFLETGQRLFPASLATLMLAIGLVVVSLPNTYFLWLLRRWRVARQAHIHRRDGEPATYHRRHDDPPAPGASA